MQRKRTKRVLDAASIWVPAVAEVWAIFISFIMLMNISYNIYTSYASSFFLFDTPFTNHYTMHVWKTLFGLELSLFQNWTVEEFTVSKFSISSKYNINSL